MVLKVTSAVLDCLLAEARAAYPNECCGLLFGAADLVAGHRPAANIHPTPQTHFEIDPRVLIDAHRAMRNGGPRVAGYYHSHPLGPAKPSATDRALAAQDGMIWAIAGEGRVGFWRAGDDGLTPLRFRLTGA